MIQEEAVEALCAVVAGLDPSSRRRLVEIALGNGYAVKDLAEIMSVSPPAVSRYIHGSLAPSPGAVCRLILGVEPRLQRMLVEEAARSLWRLLRRLLESQPDSLHSVVEEIADDIAEIMERAGKP